MSDPSAERCSALEKKLADLQGENEILIERAEDILLLGLVAEAISHQIEPEDIMATVLERISILKDVPYCALVQLEADSATLTQEYTVLREEPPRNADFIVSPFVADELQQGATLIPDSELPTIWTSLGFTSADVNPRSALLVPFVTTHHNRAGLLLADPLRRPEVLAALLPLLEQVTRAATARIENASLFLELEELTDSLNRIVRERTAELTQANEDLQLAATFFKCVREGIIITSPDTKILAVNRSFCAITGYAEEDILGQTPKILASGRHDEEFYRDMWAAIEEVGGWRGEIWNRRKSGEVYPEMLSITALRDDNGELTHYVGMFCEIEDGEASESR
jgi:PAS domain S-box-containing protein